MESELRDLDIGKKVDNRESFTETIPRTSKESHHYEDRDLSLRPVPAVDIAIRDVSVILRNSITFLSKLQRKKPLDVAQNDKRILDGVSADFPSGSFTGTT